MIINSMSLCYFILPIYIYRIIVCPRFIYLLLWNLREKIDIFIKLIGIDIIIFSEKYKYSFYTDHFHIVHNIKKYFCIFFTRHIKLKKNNSGNIIDRWVGNHKLKTLHSKFFIFHINRSGTHVII